GEVIIGIDQRQEGIKAQTFWRDPFRHRARIGVERVVQQHHVGDQDQHQDPHRHRADDEGDAEPAEARRRVGHGAASARGRMRASAVAKWTSTLLCSRISGTSPSLDMVRVTGGPTGLARLMFTRIPSKTSPTTVEARVLYELAAGGFSRRRSGRTKSSASSPALRWRGLRPVRRPKAVSICASPLRTSTMRPSKRLFSPTKEATKAVSGLL